MQDKIPTIAELRELSLQLLKKIPYLKMLVLFGSRSTGNINANSDWDFAVLYDETHRNYDFYDMNTQMKYNQEFTINLNKI